jgi:prophage antirepressor-like protein
MMDEMIKTSEAGQVVSEKMQVATEKMQVFEFSGKQVEILVIDGKTLFNPRHVAECLDIADSTLREHLASMNANQVVLVTSADVGSTDIRKIANRGENFLTESGVYRLIIKSRKPEAEKFQDWVTDEVLPSIRKRGFYGTPAVMDELISNPAFLIKILQNYQAEKERAKLLEYDKKELQVKLEQCEEWWTVTRFVKAVDFPNKDLPSIQRLGKKLVAMSQALDRPVKKSVCGRYGSVNTYHIDVFKIMFPEYANQLDAGKIC